MFWNKPENKTDVRYNFNPTDDITVKELADIFHRSMFMNIPLTISDFNEIDSKIQRHFIVCEEIDEPKSED